MSGLVNAAREVKEHGTFSYVDQVLTSADLVAAGVGRISLATSLYRAAMSGLVNAAREVKEQGTFSYVDQVLTSAEMSTYLKS
jgi:2-methylisocitrate lyase-like PEP mutase family enzyme